MLRTYVTRAFLAAFAVVALSLVLGNLLGQPILLSFVTTGSMSPTLDSGDGFVAVPDQVGGDINEGDVIVFEAEELNGGGLTTHRVVDETEAGYITKGDANAFIDQDGDEPPVTEDRIVGTAVQVDGNIIRLPGFGAAVLGVRDFLTSVQGAVTATLGLEEESGTQGIGAVAVLAGLALLTVTILDTTRRRARERDRSRRRETGNLRYVALFLVAIVVLPANAAMLGPTTTHEVTLDGTELETAVDPGDPVENEVTVTNSGLVTMLVLFEPPDGPSTLTGTELAVTGGGSRTVSLSTPAPPPGEQRSLTVRENRYVLILPQSLLTNLHEIHPLAALGAINAALVFAVLALFVGFLGLGRRRTRTANRDVPLWLKLRRLLR